jgi:hypothetical protein
MRSNSHVYRYAQMDQLKSAVRFMSKLTQICTRV